MYNDGEVKYFRWTSFTIGLSDTWYYYNFEINDESLFSKNYFEQNIINKFIICLDYYFRECKILW